MFHQILYMFFRRKLLIFFFFPQNFNISENNIVSVELAPSTRIFKFSTFEIFIPSHFLSQGEPAPTVLHGPSSGLIAAT